MTRKKLNLNWIVSGCERRASLRKRRSGLVKKVSELSILCGVSASVIIYSPGEREPTTWPTPPEVQENLARFYCMPEIERVKKMMDQETYLKETICKVEEQLKKQQMKNKEMEVSDLMHYIYQSNYFDAVSVNDFYSLIWFAQEKRKEIKKRVDYFQRYTLPLSSFSFAPFSGASHTPDQAPKLVIDQMASNTGGNIIGSDYDHHGKTSIESIMLDQWFNDMMNNTDKVDESSSKVNIDQMTPYQPFVPGSSSRNQMPLVDYRNYPSNFGGFSGAEFTMGLQPYEGFKGLIDTGGTNMPMLQPQAPSHIGDGRDISDFTSELQPDVSMALMPSHFEGNGSGNDIALDLQSFGNVGMYGSGNANSNDMRLPFEFFGGNILASDIGLPYDVTKEISYQFPS